MDIDVFPLWTLFSMHIVLAISAACPQRVEIQVIESYSAFEIHVAPNANSLLDFPLSRAHISVNI
ncbi:hypothetical protein PTI98_000214 [Pleurotus ostreatus]|nr:hypothetical protein PTI98_000214 [Pleurotus ostreatus]